MDHTQVSETCQVAACNDTDDKRRSDWQRLSDEALSRIAESDAKAHLSDAEEPHAV